MFQQVVQNNKIEKAPVLEVIKRQPKQIILSAFVRMAEHAPFYIFTAFVFAYTVGTLHMSRNFILTAVLVASCVSFVSIPLSGHISDKIGRRRMYMIGSDWRSYLLWNGGHGDTIACVHRDRALAHSARYAIRSAGCADCRSIYASPALQRRVARILTCVCHCRRSGTADRNCIIRRLSNRLCDRDLYRRLCSGKTGGGGTDARLHR